VWLGFHALGLFIHSDAAAALGQALHQIHARPAAAEWAQAGSGLRVLAPRLGPGDFSAHHSLALGAHTAALAQLKGALDAAGSSLAPDKAAHGFGFPCDGPGRGGSCDASAWDSAYLASFWVLNTPAWAAFYGHWRSAAPAPHFRAASLLGWFRDYLWYFSAAAVRGYGAAGTAEGAAPGWAFLLGHLAWAAGFMFLISWRGYWQEVVEILAYAHLAGAPAAPALPWAGALPPAALSIAQARLAGLAHFSAGAPGTYFSFLAFPS
jgi:photosystem I P700 chlorophyll a apoprotein A2